MRLSGEPADRCPGATPTGPPDRRNCQLLPATSRPVFASRHRSSVSSRQVCNGRAVGKRREAIANLLDAEIPTLLNTGAAIGVTAAIDALTDRNEGGHEITGGAQPCFRSAADAERVLEEQPVSAGTVRRLHAASRGRNFRSGAVDFIPNGQPRSDSARRLRKS